MVEKTDPDRKFEEHLREVFGERSSDFSEHLRADLRSLWARGITSGISPRDVGVRPPMTEAELEMHTYQPRETGTPLPRPPPLPGPCPDRFPAVREGMEPPGYPSAKRDTRKPMCPGCGGTGMGDYPYECHTCGGSGNA